MGHCCSKDVTVDNHDGVFPADHQQRTPSSAVETRPTAGNGAARTPAHSFTASPWQSPYPAGVEPSPARTPGKKSKWPFPPPSPAKPIMSSFMKRQAGTPPANPIPEEGGESGESQLDKSFGYPKNFTAKYELGKEVGRGHFGHTCWAKGKKGELKNQQVAVKIISKAKVCGRLQLLNIFHNFI